MSLCRPCRDLSRRQLRALIELGQGPRGTALQNPAITRRHFHQTVTPFEEQKKASILINAVKAILPRSAVQPYAIFGATESMYKACSEPAAYTISEELRKKEEVPMTEDGMELGVGTGIWYEEFGLAPTFSNWSQVTMLHVYLLIVRLRCLEKDAWQAWQTQLVNHFFQHAEDTMEINHGMRSRMVRSSHLNTLFQTWRGVVLAYDEGLAKGDAVMAAAVWRNIYMSREDVDMRHVAAIVSWMRLTLRRLDRMLDSTLLYLGASVFSTQPTAELRVVDELVSLKDIKMPARPAQAASTKKGIK